MDVEEVLEPVGALDAAHLLGFLGTHAIPGVEHWDGVTYSRSLRVGSGAAVVQLRAGRRGVELRARLSAGGVLAAEDVVTRCRHLTAVDDDTTSADAALAADLLLGPLVRARPGLRVPGSADHAETLVRTVVGQQVSVAAARGTTGRLVAMAGQRLPVELCGVVPQVTHLFPEPAALAALEAASLPMPRARGRSLVALGAAIERRSGALPDDDALLALPGIGPWTVAYTRLRTRRDPDVLLETDLAVRRQLEAMGSPGDVASARALGRRWAPYRSTALLHLWTAYLSSRRAA